MLDPYKVIQKLKKSATKINERHYNSLVDRAIAIGAESDFENELAMNKSEIPS